jgi:dihydrofolate synthase/folylpolyglutamate synthase
MFNTIKEAVSWLEQVKRFGDKLDLHRIQEACEMLGNPQDDFDSIHVGGTNGKGSTVTYLKNILMTQGYNVGTFTSPYIVVFNERITLNGNYISDDALLQYINRVYDLSSLYTNKNNDVITFFELVTLISFLYFSESDVDIVLYEVGLGGRLDATNVIQPLISVITNIGMDHMGVLGNTLHDIAFEKLGIVKQNTPLVSTVQDEELVSLFERFSEGHNSLYYKVHLNEDLIEYGEPTTFEYRNVRYKINMMGRHQVYNASLAVEVCHVLNMMDGYHVTEDSIKAGLLKASWPGRLERFGNIILDGAHNVDAMEVLKEAMLTYFGNERIIVLYTSMADKEYFDMIQILDSFAYDICFTEFDYYRCEKAETLFEISSHTKKTFEKNPKLALADLKSKYPKDIILVTGSLYFISYMRQLMQ